MTIMLFDSPQPLTKSAIANAKLRGAYGALRYYSTRALLGNPRATIRSKDLTHREALLGGPDWVWFTVWEVLAKAALKGASQGDADGRAAVAQAKVVGQPTGTAIYFAIDFDPEPTSRPTCLDYAKGALTAAATAGYQGRVYAPGSILCEGIDKGILTGPQWLTGGRGMSGYQEFIGRGLPYIEQMVGDPNRLDNGGAADDDRFHLANGVESLAGLGGFKTSPDGRSLVVA